MTKVPSDKNANKKAAAMGLLTAVAATVEGKASGKDGYIIMEHVGNIM
jgi:hypothetical protein